MMVATGSLSLYEYPRLRVNTCPMRIANCVQTGLFKPFCWIHRLMDSDRGAGAEDGPALGEGAAGNQVVEDEDDQADAKDDDDRLYHPPNEVADHGLTPWPTKTHTVPSFPELGC